ncbi:MAG TPA: 4-(cytidine 5'-diphospho)-2-C-methyl-D-erythritol kinase [Afifellaceae bacterium]|nr:4-(cytidine 5'-diphospho)-2-C-methyl-D-erythritol kinase [Afifellaceae bacterium]
MAEGRGSGGPLRRLAPAKVNLALHVTGRRPDGYHLLDALAVFADFGDCVTVTPAAEIELSLGGEFAAHAPGGAENLAWRAAALLRQAAGTDQGAHIHIDKAIPAGAGLGGGSADAAATLLALNELWQTGWDHERLAALAVTLGADVPMCVYGRPLRARGIGEAITPLSDVPVLPLVLAWPGVTLDTGQVFAALSSRENPPLPDPPPFAGAADLAAWLAACRNDLEAPATRLAPVVADVLRAIRAADACLLARMSGSGSGCFGLFTTTAAAEAAAIEIAAAQPDWWVRPTAVRPRSGISA